MKKITNILGAIEAIKSANFNCVMIGTDRYEPSEAVYGLRLLENQNEIVKVWVQDNSFFII